MVPTMVFGSEMWSLSVQERRKIQVFENMCLINMWHRESGQIEKCNNKRGAGVS